MTGTHWHAYDEDMTVGVDPNLVASVQVEAWFEYPRETYKLTTELGNLRVDDPDSDVWDKTFDKPPYNGDARGCLVIAEVTRLGTEIVRTRAIKGGPCHQNKAREALTEFRRLKAEGSLTPWDQDRTFRDSLAAAKAAQEQGRQEELSLLKEMFTKLLNKPETQEQKSVSPGSHVTDSSTNTPSTKTEIKR